MLSLLSLLSSLSSGSRFRFDGGAASGVFRAVTECVAPAGGVAFLAALGRMFCRHAGDLPPNCWFIVSHLILAWFSSCSALTIGAAPLPAIFAICSSL